MLFRSPGGEVTAEMLGDADVDHLILAGHLVAIDPPTPTTTAEQAIPKKEK